MAKAIWERFNKSKKEYTCNKCDKKIKKGIPYIQRSLETDDKVILPGFVVKLHLGCVPAHVFKETATKRIFEEKIYEDEAVEEKENSVEEKQDNTITFDEAQLEYYKEMDKIVDDNY